MWWTGGALGFDTETDGRDPLDARLITAGLVSLTPGNPPQEMPETMLQPERDIPAEATAVNHITTEMARENGVPREAGLAQIVTTIAELAGETRPLVLHNAPYDLTVLDREMRRVGIGSLSTDIDTGFVSLRVDGRQIARFPVIDTLVLDKAVDRYRPGKRQLSFVAAHYGVPMAEGAAHGATADVYASLRIAWRISKLCEMADDYMTTIGPKVFITHPFMRLYAGRRDPLDFVRAFYSLGQLSLEQLHYSQSVWAKEQAEGLRDYFIETGKKAEAATVDGTWPFRPVPAFETVTSELI